MNYLRFIHTHRRFLGFGVFAAWTSSFGQTYFVSFFTQDFQAEFQLSHTEFGALYAAATALAGFLLIRAGRLIDQVPLSLYVTAVAVGLALSCVAAAAAWHVLVLFAALFGLRLCGQGLMSHISITSMARHFDRTRGRAVAIAPKPYSDPPGMECECAGVRIAGVFRPAPAEFAVVRAAC